MADQATKIYADGNMQEMTREQYIKTHGFDPEPVLHAVNKWREDQIRKWAVSQGKDEKKCMSGLGAFQGYSTEYQTGGNNLIRIGGVDSGGGLRDLANKRKAGERI